MDTQLQLCRDLFQAVLSSNAGCHALADFNNQLLDALQRLMLELQQQQQEEQTRAVRQCLEAVLHLFSRVGCLGPIETFFTADDLLFHYQQRLDAVVILTNKLHEQRQQRGTALAMQRGAHAAAAPGHLTSSTASGSQQMGVTSRSMGSCQLQLPQQQLRVVASFRQQAAQLCPRLTGSCTTEQLQQLCDTVKEGLVLVNGHSFLINQEWQSEVSAMKARAEQLKMLLAHRQAHHISLLAGVLQHIHKQEIQEFDLPQQQQLISAPSVGTRSPSPLSSSNSPSRLSYTGQGLTGYRQAGSAAGGATAGAAAVPANKQQGQQQGQQQARVLVAAGLEAVDEVLGQEEDEFYMPVAPLPVLSISTASTPRSSAALSSLLPFGLGLFSADASDDALSRMPSSGCSSLMEYVHSIPPSSSITGAAIDGSIQHNTAQAALRRITEEQLHGIAGPEIASVLAAALGVTLDLGDLDRSERSEISSRYSSSSNQGRASHNDWDSRRSDSAAAAAGTAVLARPGSALATYTGGSSSGRFGDATAPSEVAARQCSEPLMSRLVSSSGKGSSPLQPQQQQRPRRPGSGGSRGSSAAVGASSKKCPPCELRLQHMPLPPGCCKSIGAVLYLSPHLTRLTLSDVGIDDQAVFDLVDALKVNSSIVMLNLSQNRVEDLGARALAGLLRQRPGSSSQLRALYLQDNVIGDDGAIALASSLSHNSTLQRLWLQLNAIGEAGALVLATAMQHNTCCTSLKLLPQSTAGMPKQLGQMAQKLAKHNKGVREHIKGLLTHMLRSKSDSG